MENHKCKVCSVVCKPLRCSRCKQALYCSLKCQKKDWKAAHRRSCIPSTSSEAAAASKALHELVTIANSLDAIKASEQYHRTVDEIGRHENDTKLAKKATSTESTTDRESKVENSECEGGAISIPQPGVFSTVTEEMKHISTFHMLLMSKEELPMDLFSLHISQKSGSTSTVEIQQDFESKRTLFIAEFPRLLGDGKIQAIDSRSLQLRLPYREDPCATDLVVPGSLTPINVVNTIACRTCRQPLLLNDPIQRTAPLPQGQWDEIADYLICYSGQPIVDFSTASASPDPSVALQDSNVLCLNKEDLCDRVSIQPVEGYGEGQIQAQTQTGGVIDQIPDPAAIIRGDRPWIDLTGGATVCCTKCGSPLGFAGLQAPDSFRLLKHRLFASKNTQPTTLHHLSSCASFLAREMARYAETKAIFTFIVALDTPALSFASNVFTKCILLRLVSWEASIATTDQESSSRLQFKRYAKIVFEETVDKSISGHRGDKSGKWIWGGVDLCCPPLQLSGDGNQPDTEEMDEKESKVSTVRIQLKQDEYDQVLESLRNGTHLFSKDVADATILVKMGTMPSQSDSKLQLTAIHLDG